jgi:hypothetical protein
MFTRYLVTALGLGCLATISSCEYFTNVIVPPQRTSEPAAWAGVYALRDGAYVSLGPGQGGAYYRTNSATDAFLAVAAGYDPDGIYAVKEYDAEWLQYCKGTGIDPDSQWVADQVVTQPGGIGQTVSNGLWTYDLVRFDQAPTECPNGYSLDHITFQWKVSAQDYFGFAEWPWGSGQIDYYPP